MSDKPSLSFELSESKDQLDIHGNAEGLRRLAKTLERLASIGDEGKYEHQHHFSEEWGTGDISAAPRNPKSRGIHMVTIHVWPGPDEA